MFLSYINYVLETNLLSLVFLFWLLPVLSVPLRSPSFPRSLPFPPFPRSLPFPPAPPFPPVPLRFPRSLPCPRSPVPSRSLVPFLTPVPPGFPGGLSFRSFWFLPVYPPLPQPFIRPSFHKH